MGLPLVPLRSEVVMVAGEEVKIRGLSTAEVTKLSTFTGRPEVAEVFLLAQATDLPEADCKAWLESTGIDVTGPLLERIGVLSGLREDSKSVPPGASGGDG